MYAFPFKDGNRARAHTWLSRDSPSLVLEKVILGYNLMCKRMSQLLSESKFDPVVCELIEADSEMHRIAPYTKNQAPKRTSFSCLGLNPSARFASVQTKHREALDSIGNKFLTSFLPAPDQPAVKICRAFNLGKCKEPVTTGFRDYCTRRGDRLYHVCWCSVCHQPTKDVGHSYQHGVCDR